MKRKILALVMACLMIVSMLPMNIFAAEHEDEIVCPETHTIDNCECTYVKEVAPECGDYGYTVYQCNACGEYFAHDIKPSTEAHEWKESKKAVAPKCGVAGNEKEETCTKCGKVRGGEAIEALKHVWGEAEGDCLVGYTVTCTLCGDKKTVEGSTLGHVWNTYPEIVKEPDLDRGIARYTCTVCGSTKDVDILPNHEHEMEYHKPVAPTCDKNGTIEYWFCTKCEIAYHHVGTTLDPQYVPVTLDKDGNAILSYLPEIWEGDVLVQAECYPELKALGHEIGKWGTYHAATCTDDAYYADCVCSRCEKKFDYIIEGTAGHDLVDHYTAPGCETYGYAWQACTVCGYMTEVIKTDPLGHTDYPTWENIGDHHIIVPAAGKQLLTFVAPFTGKFYLELAEGEENAYVTVDRGDYMEVVSFLDWDDEEMDYVPAPYYFYLNQGESITFVVETNDYQLDTIDLVLGISAEYGYYAAYGESPASCTQDGRKWWYCTRCWEYQEIVSGKLNHNLKTETIAATCGTYALKVTYCTNENCNYYGDGFGTPYYFVDKDGKEILDVDGNAIVNWDYEAGEYIFENIKLVEIVKKEYDKNNHWWNYEIINNPTCEQDGDARYLCKYCHEIRIEEGLTDEEGVVTLPAFEHNYDPDMYFSIYTYQDCENPEIRVVWCVNCWEEITWECWTECEYPYILWENPEKPALGHEYDSKVIAPTCQNKGYTYNWCTVCFDDYKDNYTEFEPLNTYTKEEAEYMHDLGGYDYLEYYAGNCIDKVGLYKYYCYDCHRYIFVKDETTAKGYHTIPAWVEELKAEATCTESVYIDEHWCEDCGKYFAGKDYIREHKLVDVAAKDATCTENGWKKHKACAYDDCDHTVGYEEIPAIWHVNAYVADSSIASCEKVGYIHHVCPDCGLEYLDQYESAWGHDWKVDEEKSYGATCEDTGLTVYYCANCADCEKESDVLAALGHENKDGEELIDSCLNTVKDRVCVNCKETIGQAHNWTEWTHVDATCLEYGYDLRVCVDCLKSEIANVDETYLADHTPAEEPVIENRVEPTYTDKGSYDEVIYCDICDIELSRETKEIPALVGVEYTLLADNAIVPGAGYTDGSLIKVTVVLDGADINVWGLNFDVSYNKKLVKFESATFISDAFIVNTSVHDNDGYVSVIASMYNDENGHLQNYVLGEDHAVVELYFRVIAAGENTVEFGIGPESFICDIEQNEYNYHYEPMSIETELFLDVNGDGAVNMADAVAAYNAYLDGTYIVALDTDRDGVITGIDIIALYNYLIEAVTYESLVGRE